VLWRASDSSRIECHGTPNCVAAVAAPTTTNSAAAGTPPTDQRGDREPGLPGPTMMIRRCVNPDRITLPAQEGRGGNGRRESAPAGGTGRTGPSGAVAAEPAAAVGTGPATGAAVIRQDILQT
jgi:hypothetical protein